jgi:hypothetical protein
VSRSPTDTSLVPSLFVRSVVTRSRLSSSSESSPSNVWFVRLLRILSLISDSNLQPYVKALLFFMENVSLTSVPDRRFARIRRGISRLPLRRHQPLRHSRQACYHSIEGYPTCKTSPRRAILNGVHGAFHLSTWQTSALVTGLRTHRSRKGSGWREIYGGDIIWAGLGGFMQWFLRHGVYLPLEFAFTGCTLFRQRRALSNTIMKPYQFLLSMHVTLDLFLTRCLNDLNAVTCVLPRRNRGGLV